MDIILLITIFRGNLNEKYNLRIVVLSMNIEVAANFARNESIFLEYLFVEIPSLHGRTYEELIGFPKHFWVFRNFFICTLRDI